MSLVPAAPAVEVHFRPPPPEGLEPEIEKDWVRFWASGQVTVLHYEHHGRAFVRLFRLYSDELRLRDLTEGREMVLGSQGQQVLNPACRHLATIRHQILELEQQFGLTPRGSLSLGMQVGKRKSLADLSRESNEQSGRKAKARRTARAG